MKQIKLFSRFHANLSLQFSFYDFTFIKLSFSNFRRNVISSLLSYYYHISNSFNSFSSISDLDDTLLQTLMEFVQQLVCSGDLTMAKALRVKILEKHACKQMQVAAPILSSLSVSTKQATLLDFKSEQIAEQMTLLDAELFMKIEIPEVLIWAQEQNEERSPNLTRFTEHFNKMSYWARSRILEHRWVFGAQFNAFSAIIGCMGRM